MGRSYPVPLTDRTAAATSKRSWVRLSAAAMTVFGPSRWWMLELRRSAGPARLHAAERRWARAARAALGMRLDLVGLDHIDPAQPYLVAPLHEGLADAICLLHLPLELTFAAGDELYDWRTIEPYLAASGSAPVPADTGPPGYHALVAAARTAVERGDSLVIFPQGTILGIEAAFQPEAFSVAERLGLAVLPVVISGTHRVWEHPYTPTVRTGIDVHVEVLEAVPGDRITHEAEALQKEMKQIALGSGIEPRHFEPDRDGWWDDHAYEIDPAYPELARRLAEHRDTPADSRA